MDTHALRPYFLLALIILSSIVAFAIFLPFLAPLLMAIVFAVVLSPVHGYLRSRSGGRDSLSALVTVVAMLVCVLLPLSMLATIVGFEARQLYTTLVSEEENIADRATENIDAFLSSQLPGISVTTGDIASNVRTYLEQGLEWLLRNTASAAASAAAFALSLLLFFIALFYLLRDGARFKQAVIHLSPLSHEDDEILFGRLERAINSVIKGNLSIALIQGIIAAVGFTIFGLPNSVIWGTLTAFAALIPGVGTSLVVIPAVIYLFFASGMFPAIGLLVWGVLAVGLIDNFLGPKLIGSGMRLHPLFVLFAVLGGISLFGAIGIFLGPLTLAFLVALVSVYLDRSPHELAAEGERAAG